MTCIGRPCLTSEPLADQT